MFLWVISLSCKLVYLLTYLLTQFLLVLVRFRSLGIIYFEKEKFLRFIQLKSSEAIMTTITRIMLEVKL